MASSAPKCLSGQFEHAIAEPVERLVVLFPAREERPAAEFREDASQLRLEHDDKRDGEEDRIPADEPADDDQIQRLAEDRQRHQEQDQPGQHAGGPGATEIDVNVVNARREEGDFHQRIPMGERVALLLDKLEECLPHRRIRLAFRERNVYRTPVFNRRRVGLRRSAAPINSDEPHARARRGPRAHAKSRSSPPWARAGREPSRPR